MLLRVRHQTTYRYDAPIDYSIQALRMTPLPYEGQQVRHWSISVNGRTGPGGIPDGYGNLTTVVTTPRRHRELVVTVEGEVRTTDTGGVVRGVRETLPPAFYLRPTELTAADEAIDALAAGNGPGDAQGDAQGDGTVLERLHLLMATLRGRIAYTTGVTGAATTAAQALRQGSGVCQDHAHAFIAVARRMGVPARYVSGYLLTPGAPSEADAAHAWAEAHVDGLGWVGFDAANGVCPTGSYVRTAIGLDYWSAAPVRGIWRGNAAEDLSVRVRVEDLGQEQ
ncbi:transglutaminase family protein [Arenibaculum sp.]|uniref:transglutaminase family protein n=1 Tax=Arenibaculum sp. TaxID=2865862 RepID=UPI002E11CE80|nr:transglutaminase family protein [Arenibaculum sp.]